MRAEQAGQFFLKQRGARGVWQICWYEGRQTRSVSCRTSDLQVAQQKLYIHALNHSRPVVASDDQLASVLARYYEQHARHLPSAGGAKVASKAALETFGDANVSQLDRKAQLEFVRRQRAAGLSDWTIQNQLGRVWAAIQWAKRDNPQLVVPAMISAADWRPVLKNRERVYSPQELAALLDAAAEHEHWWRFTVLAIGTASREAALRELKWPQVSNVIELNPSDRAQTKKRRATVPIAPTVGLELDSWERTGEFVLGREMRTREFFDALEKKSGVAGGPNAIRHTVRTWFAEHGVPDADADMFMGHKTAGSHTGARYTHRKPEYLKSCTAALELLFAEVRAHMAGPRQLAGSRETRGNSVAPFLQLADSLAEKAVA